MAVINKLVLWSFLCALCFSAAAQQQGPAPADTSFKPSGKLWGYSFGDYYYKAHADAQNRGGANQYSTIEEGRNAFQIRRVYLGYNYDIHPKFAAELLLAAEDNVTDRNGVTTGDLLLDNKLTFYIKLANLRWKNIWKGTDLVVGQSATPAFVLVVEPIWGYRSIERTLVDRRRVPSFDLGVSLQGKFDPQTANFGYNLMVSNGTGDQPENNKFKWFAADVFAKLLDKRLVFDLYADYQRFNWTHSFHHARNMLKGFVAYDSPSFTVGVEAFVNHGQQDVIGTYGTVSDTLTAMSKALSVFAKGVLVKDKLNFFARSDWFNPYHNFKDGSYESYKGLTAGFEPNNKENFITAGVDFTPIKNVHLMPNVWYNGYYNQRSDATGSSKYDYDLVYRITFFYVYGR